MKTLVKAFAKATGKRVRLIKLSAREVLEDF